jgi:acetyl-CoA C-acetyltransferase
MRDEPGTLDPATPILVGVGVAHHTPPDGMDAHTDLPDPIDLMCAATDAALDDAGGGVRRSLASRIATVAVPEGNWGYGDPGRRVADRIGLRAPRTIRVEIGVPQHAPIRAAIEGIAAGSIEAALVVGGEAKASQLARQRAGGTSTWTEADGAEADEHWWPSGEIMAEPEISAGIWAPVEQYACIDAALRHAEGVTVPEHLDQIARLWHGFNEVATRNPHAAFGAPRSEAFLRDPGPGNRPLAFPYAKWHSTQWAVDQAGAVVLCSVGLARELGIPSDRWVFPRVALESSFSASLTRRDRMGEWPAMAVLGNAAAAHLGRDLDTVEHAEVYSCFPAAVRVQQRALGLPVDGVPTVLGGMAFAGGPFNNFTYQATHEVVQRVRQDPGSLGLVTTVSGLLTKPALAVWSSEPGPSLVADLAGAADAATVQREVTGDAQGVATVASLTITYEGDEPSSSFVIADLPDGRRWIGTSTDPALLDGARRQEMIGTEVHVDGGTCRV